MDMYEQEYESVIGRMLYTATGAALVGVFISILRIIRAPAQELVIFRSRNAYLFGCLSLL